jgi:hypothetical protein
MPWPDAETCILPGRFWLKKLCTIQENYYRNQPVYEVKPRFFRVTPELLTRDDQPLNPAERIFLERLVIVDEENSPVFLETLKDGLEDAL